MGKMDSIKAEESVKEQRRQRTLRHAVSYSGIGIHTGQEVKMRFLPAPDNSGIVFKRSDLPGQPVIPAQVDYVCDTARCTTIGKENVKVYTVEHVLAAVHAMEIDNLVIEVSNVEPPVGQGSSDHFVKMIEEGVPYEQSSFVAVAPLLSPVCHTDGDITIVAIPSPTYRISYTLSYPGSVPLAAQYYSFELSPDNFKREIAPCRTFSLYSEIEPLINYGLIKGGSLDNAVIVKDDAVISKNGLFFPNEMVRHKILDMIGDLSLVARYFTAHIIAIRPGHAANFAFAKKLNQSLKEKRL